LYDSPRVSNAEPTTTAGGGAVPFRVPKTAELVAHHLRKRIVRGDLKEGESLPSETALTAQFGVSRPTLREAFRVLEAEQLITVRRGAKGGASVHAPSANMVARYAGFFLEHAGTTLAEVFDARTAIEAPAAGMAATRCTAGDVERLRAGAADCERVGEDGRLLAQHFSDFHALVVELSGNRTLWLLHAMVREIIDMAKLRRFADGGSGRRRAIVDGAKAHERLVDLIAEHDAAAAEAHWRGHLERANKFLLEFSGSDQPLDLLD
jgi:DNA-binding FadR family transcriptional regulator